MEKDVRKDLLGSVLVIAAGVFWGLTGIFVRFFTNLGLSSMQITVFKIAFAALLLLFYCLIADRNLLKVKLRDLWVFVCAGIISLDFFTICYFSTIQSTSLSVAAVLLYAAPAFVMLFSVLFFGEKLSVQKCVSCAIAFLGCFLVSGMLGGSVSISLRALGTGLLSAIGYALYSIFGDVALKKGYKPVTITTYTFIFASFGLLFIIKPDEIVAAAAKTSLPIFIFMMLLISVTVSLLPYICYTIGLTYIRPSKASIIASVEPVTATVVGAVAFREYPDIYGVVGILCVVGAIVLLNVKIGNRNARKTEETIE